MSLDTAPIQRYMRKVQSIAVARSREVRLSAEEAMELSGNIGEMLALLAAVQARLIAAASAAAPKTAADGGKF